MLRGRRLFDTSHLVGILLPGTIILASWAFHATRLSFDSPRIFLPEVIAFEWHDWRAPVPQGPAVFTGSSTIAKWSTLAEDFAPLPVLGRGINGSRIHDITFYLDELVLKHAPRLIVLYAGENDLSDPHLSKHRGPDEVLADFREFRRQVHARRPSVPIYYISIKPPVMRAEYTQAFLEANERIKSDCASDPSLHYIDIYPLLLGKDGKPRPDAYGPDGVHLSREGYRIVTAEVRRALGL
jgi:lysophospholipase L1-like esterase